MFKKNKRGVGAVMTVVLVILLLAVVGTGAFFGIKAVATGDGGRIIPTDGITCPTDGGTALTLTLQNGLNTTATESFDANIVLTSEEGDYQTGSDTTAGSYNLNCGVEYTLSIIASDGASADNSVIESIIVGKNAEIKDGKVIFTPTGDNYALQLKGSQHGVLEFRAFDENEKAFIYDSGDALNNDFETDGVTFKSTTDNATATAIGSGGELDWTIEVRATTSDTDFNDKYVLILVEAPVTVWEEPSIKWDGTTLSDVKGSLTTYEERQFSGYEYIYKVDKAIVDDIVELGVFMKAISGVDPTADVEVDFATAGNYVSVIDGVSVLTGSAKDDSTSSVVYAVQDTTFDLS